MALAPGEIFETNQLRNVDFAARLGGEELVVLLPETALQKALPLTPKPVPPGPPKQRTAVAVSPEVLERYVGSYEFAPTFVMEVTREDTVLRSQATNQQRVRLWPESETEFFLKEVDAQISFVRDSAGVVTGMVLHQNGQNPAARKVK